MPRTSTKNFSNNEGDVLHFGAVRIRVNGSGNLDLALNSLDDVHSFTLVSIPMLVATNIEPLQLSNLSEQRASLRISTNNINEWFFITKITLFVKPVATSVPQ